MSLRRNVGSVSSLDSTGISFLDCSRLDAEGVISLFPPLPAGFGAMFPSINQKALLDPYNCIVGNSHHNRPSRVDLLFQQRPHLFRLRNMRIGIDYQPHEYPPLSFAAENKFFRE